jgi:hypothetical protein
MSQPSDQIDSPVSSCTPPNTRGHIASMVVLRDHSVNKSLASKRG